jgi:pimeloyl-ACP methyl ester carboxylesterase
MAYRGGVETIQYMCGGDKIIGVMYPAVGSGARPAAVLLHGVLGSEKNFDIAYRLRDMGWHTLIPFFRGSWGSGGVYDITKQPEDVTAALDYLLNTRADWEVDQQRIALVGYSLGSRAAIVTAHRDPRVEALVSISGIADFDELMLSEDFYRDAANFLTVSAPALHKQWSGLGGAENPITLIGQIRQPALIIHGTEDEVVPYYMGSALHEARKDAEFVTIQGADHTFTQHRAPLVEAVSGWLDRWGKGK